VTFGEFLVLVLIAGICGALAQFLAGGRGGSLVAIALGFVGAFVGRLIADAFALPAWFAVSVGGRAFPVFWSIVGAAVLVMLRNALFRPRATE